MNGLCGLLKPDNVLLGISPGSKKRLFEQASQTLSLLYGIDKKEVFDGLFAREKLGSTYLDHGIALPHCRLPGLESPCCLFMKLHGELPGDRPGDPEISALFFLIAPEDACKEHLELLASAAQVFSDGALREKLLSAPTADVFCSELQSWCRIQPSDN